MSSPESQGASFGPPNQQPDVAGDYPLMPPGLPQMPANTDPTIPPAPTSPPEVQASPQSFALTLSMRLEGDPTRIDAIKRGLRRALMELVDDNDLGLESFDFGTAAQTKQAQAETADQAPEAGEATPQPSETPLFTPEIQQKLDTPLEDVLRRVKVVKPYSPTEESEPLPEAHQEDFIKELESAGIYSLRDVALVGTDQVKDLIHTFRRRKSVDAAIEGMVKVTPDEISKLRQKAAGIEDGEYDVKQESMRYPLFTLYQVTAFCNDIDRVAPQVLSQLYNTPALPHGWRDAQVSNLLNTTAEELGEQCGHELTQEAIAEWQAAVHRFVRDFQAVHPPQPVR